MRWSEKQGYYGKTSQRFFDKLIAPEPLLEDEKPLFSSFGPTGRYDPEETKKKRLTQASIKKVSTQ